MTTKPTLVSQRKYAAYRKAKGLPGGTQPAVSQAITRGRIKYAPGTTLIDPVQADSDWLQHTEPRPQFPSAPGTRQTDPDYYPDADADTGRARFAARQLESVDLAWVLKALHDAYRIMTAEYRALCSGLAIRAKMTVGELDKLIDETSERLGDSDSLAQCIHLAYTGEVDG